jgi:pimeloyl-ACP methyl ester carboxylesterase
MRSGLSCVRDAAIGRTVLTMLEVISKGSGTDAHPVPLLFVHGGYHGAWCWDEHFLDYFADRGFQAVAVSLRGHGQSTLSGSIRSCSIADYVDDVHSVADAMDFEPVVVGHSMGGFVVQKYLEQHRAPAAVLMASIPPQGTLRVVLRMVRRHPWTFMRCNTVGDSVDFVRIPGIARELLFSAHTPNAVVESCAARLQPESARAGLDQVRRLPKAGRVAAPLLVLGARDDGFVTNDEVTATGRTYGTEAEFFPGMGHNMMVEPGWQAVAERIDGWLTDRGL